MQLRCAQYEDSINNKYVKSLNKGLHFVPTNLTQKLPIKMFHF